MAKRCCLGCGTLMKAKRRFCTECGHRNPLAVAAAARRGTAVKSAGAGPAPVYDLEAARYQQLVTAFKSAGGNAALRDGYSAMLTDFAVKGGDAA